jgi:hypothetical protein
MHTVEESDDFVVPSKRVNNAGTPVAEPVEERGSTKGNVAQQATDRTQSRNSVTSSLSGVRLVRLLRQPTVTPEVGAV